MVNVDSEESAGGSERKPEVGEADNPPEDSDVDI
jgi:hypothetical protein